MATNRLLKIVFSLIGLGVATHSVAFNGFGTDIDGYIKDASNRYQVDEAMLRGLVKIEDGWYGNVSPTGATGVGQFTRAPGIGLQQLMRASLRYDSNHSLQS